MSNGAGVVALQSMILHNDSEDLRQRRIDPSRFSDIIIRTIMMITLLLIVLLLFVTIRGGAK